MIVETPGRAVLGDSLGKWPPAWGRGTVQPLLKHWGGDWFGDIHKSPFRRWRPCSAVCFCWLGEGIYKARKQTKSHNGSNSEFKHHLHSCLANLLRKKRYFSTKILGV